MLLEIDDSQNKKNHRNPCLFKLLDPIKINTSSIIPSFMHQLFIDIVVTSRLVSSVYQLLLWPESSYATGVAGAV